MNKWCNKPNLFKRFDPQEDLSQRHSLNCKCISFMSTVSEQITKSFSDFGRYLQPSIRKISYEGCIVAAGQIVAAIGGIAMISCLSRLLDTEDFGTLSLCLVSIPLLQSLYAGVGLTLVRFFQSAIDKDSVTNLLQSIWYDWLQRTLLLLFLVSSIACVLVYFEPSLLMVILLIAIATIGSSAGTVCDHFHTANRDRVPVATHQAFSSWFKLLFGGTMTYCLGSGVLGPLFGITFAICLVAIVQYWSYSQAVSSFLVDVTGRCEKKSEESWVPQVVEFSRPIIIWNLAIIIQQTSDRWAVEYFCSRDALGSYSAVLGVTGVPFMLVFQCAGLLALPVIFRQVSHSTNLCEKQSLIKRGQLLTYFVVFVVIGVTAAGFLCAGPVAGFLLDNRYSNARQLIPIFIFNGGLFGLAQLMELQVLAVTSSWKLAQFRVATALLTILFVMIGGSLSGTFGIAIATSVSRMLVVSGLSVALYYNFLRRGQE